MRFGDKLRFAFHNIWNAKSRNFLTIIIVFIVSLLILVIGISCVNMATNISAAMKLMIQDSTGNFMLNAKDFQQNNNHYITPTITNEEYDKFVEEMSNTRYCESITSNLQTGNISVELNNDRIYSSNIGLADYRFGFFDSGTLLQQGRIWQPSDSNTPKAYIDKLFMKQMEKVIGKPINIGDTINMNLNFFRNNSNSEGCLVPLEIIGILDEESANGSYDYAFYSVPDILFDITYARNIFQKPFLTNCKANFELPNTKHNFNATITELMTLTKKIDKQFERGYEQTYRVDNNFVSELQTANIINIAIVGLGIILGFIVLLLSIGSVSNTIIISIDKNRRFTGLMMAMGMKHKNVKSIVRMESTITIFIGILLSTILCYCLTPVFNSILSNLFSSLLLPLESFVFKFTIPIYFPIGVVVVFALMATLFTRGGLRKLGNLDPITVISEVS